jgi:hypothetical protein
MGGARKLALFREKQAFVSEKLIVSENNELIIPFRAFLLQPTQTLRSGALYNIRV